MKINLIACVDKNFGIGFDGKLLFRSKTDMNMFKNLTKASGIVVMGRKTYESIGHCLPGRLNIVLSKSLEYNEDYDDEDLIICKTYFELKSLLNLLSDKYSDCFIIGGESIYKEFIDRNNWNSIYLTYVDHEFDNCDVYFPKEWIKNLSVICKTMLSPLSPCLPEFYNKYSDLDISLIDKQIEYGVDTKLLKTISDHYSETLSENGFDITFFKFNNI